MVFSSHKTVFIHGSGMGVLRKGQGMAKFGAKAMSLVGLSGVLAWYGSTEGTARAETPAWTRTVRVPEHVESIDGTVWEFSLNEGKATITGGGPESGDMIIPARLGGCPVTAIEEETFFERRELTSVTMPDCIETIGNLAFLSCDKVKNLTLSANLKEIGMDAFSHCCALTKVDIPEGVTSIKSSAFSGCTGLEEVTISDSVRDIGGWAFAGCTALKKVTIGSGVKDYGGLVFGYCPNLTEIRIAADNPSFTIEDGVLFWRAVRGWKGQGLWFVPRNRTGTYVVPDGVEWIAERAFEECNGLTRVVLPDSLRAIGRNAFRKCQKLERVDFGNGVQRIGEKAFLECEQLGEVELPDSVREISNHVFCSCKNLKSLVLGPGVQEIGWNAFAKSGLETLNVPASWKDTPMLKWAGVPETCQVMYGEE